MKKIRDTFQNIKITLSFKNRKLCANLTHLPQSTTLNQRSTPPGHQYCYLLVISYKDMFVFNFDNHHSQGSQENSTHLNQSLLRSTTQYPLRLSGYSEKSYVNSAHFTFLHKARKLTFPYPPKYPFIPSWLFTYWFFFHYL